MVSLLSISRSYLNDVLINEVSNSFNEKKDKIYTATNIVLATLYAKIIERSNSKELDKVYREIISSNFNNIDYIKLEDIFRRNNNLLIAESQTILSAIFSSEEMEKISASITKEVEITKDNIIALFKMLLPIVVGSINKVYFNERLDKIGFVNLLNKQANFLSNENIPDELANEFSTVYNLQSLDKESAKIKSNTLSKPNFKIIIIAVIAFLLFAIAYYLISKKHQSATKETIEKQKNISKNTVVSDSNYLYNPTKKNIGNYIKGYEILGFFKEREIKGGNKILLLSKGGIEGLLNHIESNTPIDKNKWFNIHRILIKKNAGIIDTKKSASQLNQLVQIMKIYPDINIKIGVCTDNRGPAKHNFDISYKIAEITTKELTKRGIDSKRIQFEGYGENYPTYDNDSYWGRKLNNRVTIRLSKK